MINNKYKFHFEILENLMKEKAVNASTLSKTTGISTGNLSDWKSGRSRPTLDALCVLADYFNVTVDFLVGRTEK